MPITVRATFSDEDLVGGLCLRPGLRCGSRRPIAMLGTGVETKAVLDFIRQLEKGIFI